MSHSNLDIEYEAQKREQEQDTIVFDFETSKKDIVGEQELTRVSESIDCQEQLLSEETNTDKFTDGSPPEVPLDCIEKVLRKKDSTGVRWVDWEGVAAISVKKGIHKCLGIA